MAPTSGKEEGSSSAADLDELKYDNGDRRCSVLGKFAGGPISGGLVVEASVSGGGDEGDDEPEGWVLEEREDIVTTAFSAQERAELYKAVYLQYSLNM